MAVKQITLYIDPPSHHFLGDRLFNEEYDGPTGDHLLAPYVYLRRYFRELGVEVRTADFLPTAVNDHQNIYVSMGRLDSYREVAKRGDTVVSAYFAMECPIVEPLMYKSLSRATKVFRRIYSWSDCDTLRRFVGSPLRVEKFFWPQSFDDVHEDFWRQRDRKFLVMINANKLPRVYFEELYTERMRAVEYFDRYNEVDLYGKGWDQPSMRVGRTRLPYTLVRLQNNIKEKWDKVCPDPLLVSARKAYRGQAKSKSQTLAQYKFALCFENAKLTGWITEKIFDCFFAGAIPVYWGAPDIASHIPEECFIDMRRFRDYGELRQCLKSMSEREIDDYKESARKFLRSEQFIPFSKRNFASLFRGIVEADTGLPLGNLSTRN